ncbi:allantoinase AllB [Turneriella parva]|uniref:allantoinase n=1 Tax=Turneriella parva (strain ATCC BAA-1111 / DSM 21527 / NCTC 11395 / H) TaxID=869212 RepID=I4B3T3_TURPD|nr:allantoinase AllB [Turneriella parva]AFM11940.1 allantoinase [Turneriella parva DSM 21527]
MRTLLKSRRAIIDNEVRPAAVLVEGEKIREILPYDADIGSSNIRIVDYGDLALMPGVVDTHVHINEPGRTEWEGFSTATAAAAKGGITTLVDMPLNCDPVTTTVAALQSKVKACSNLLHVDCGFYGGVIPGNVADLEPLIDAGVLGFKSFLIHSGIHEFPHVTEADIRAAIPILKKGGVPYLMHAELESPVINGSKAAVDHRRYSTYLASRPRKWENDAVELMARLAGETNAHLHVVHLSSSDALSTLAATRQRGVPITVETCHHYLTYCAEEIPDGHTEYKCAPPIRERENREQLWKSIADGTIDFAVSDHSPCTPNLKERHSGDFMKAWGGIAGLQFSLSVFYNGAKARGFDLAQVSRALSASPAAFVGLKDKGSIAVGKDADFAVFDTEVMFRVEPGMIAHRHDVSPYIGMQLTGLVKETWLRGQRVFGGDAPIAPAGRPILRSSTG